ncbi:ABC transporter substrate-binding protein [Chitinimonas sp. BJYL2]|uniref:substrate-binding periplasmic protein n=1 Tax=Chitinimonas sp. BJYL2 TaxID=2976696 RepID=UPI0022B5E2B2|nr:ABC transporter substrate-binding protein [Chitinimonas sp. BJYL2]
MLRSLTILLLSLCAIPSYALRIYTEEWPPISYQTNGVADGMAVEVVREIQTRLNDKTPIEVVPWARGYEELLNKPGTLLFTVGRSEAREKLMTLLGPIAISETVLLARKGEAAKLQAMGDEIKRLGVGAYRGSIFADAAQAAGFKQLDLAPTPQIAAQKLLAGRYPLWSEGSIAVTSILKDIQQPIDAVEQVRVLESLNIYLAFSRGTPGEEIRRWHSALVAIKKEGTFARIYKKWLPRSTVPNEVELIGLPPR